MAHNLGVPLHCVMCAHNGDSSFTAPETGACDCEPGASSSASSAWRNLRDHRSELRFVGEAIWYVDGIQLVDDSNHTAHLRLRAWKDTHMQTDRWRHTTTTRQEESRCVNRDNKQSKISHIIRDELLFYLIYLSFSPALKGWKHSL